MRSGWQTLGAIAFLTILLTQFTNCDVYSDSSVFNTFATVCTGEKCMEPNDSYVEIKVNSEGDIPMNATRLRVDLGGECNEGGYKTNIITWNLYNAAGFVTNSTAVGADTSCRFGRFITKVITPATGVQYTVEVQIKSFDDSGKEKTSPLAKRRIFLQPVAAGL